MINSLTFGLVAPILEALVYKNARYRILFFTLRVQSYQLKGSGLKVGPPQCVQEIAGALIAQALFFVVGLAMLVKNKSK